MVTDKSRAPRRQLPSWNPSRTTSPSSKSSSPRRPASTTGTPKVAQEWFPHDYIPYRLGRDFDKEPWTPDQPRLTGVAQTSFEVNLLTEDNLPSYHRLIHGMFGARRRRVDQLDRPLDGRGGPPRDRPPRLPDGDPQPRPDRPRARPDDPAPAGLRPRFDRHAPRSRLRGLPGARDPDLAQEHRPLLAGPGGRPDHEPDRGRREPAHGLLPRHPRRRAEDPAVAGGPGDRRRGPRVRDAGHRHPGLPAQGRGDRAGPASTTSGSTATRS